MQLRRIKASAGGIHRIPPKTTLAYMDIFVKEKIAASSREGRVPRPAANPKMPWRRNSSCRHWTGSGPLVRSPPIPTPFFSTQGLQKSFSQSGRLALYCRHVRLLVGARGATIRTFFAGRYSATGGPGPGRSNGSDLDGRHGRMGALVQSNSCAPRTASGSSLSGDR